jgi:hypothetical protein
MNDEDNDDEAHRVAEAVRQTGADIFTCWLAFFLSTQSNRGRGTFSVSEIEHAWNDFRASPHFITYSELFDELPHDTPHTERPPA